MTSLDIIIIIVFAGSLFLGWMRGIIRQLTSVGGLVLAVILCRLGGATVAGAIAGAAAEPSYFDVVLARLILFIAGYLLSWLGCTFLRRVTHAMKLGLFDRLGGALFSLVEWMLVLSLALNLWLIIRPDADLTAQSKLGEGRAVTATVKFAPAVLGWATEKYHSWTSGDDAQSDADAAADCHADSNREYEK